MLLTLIGAQTFVTRDAHNAFFFLLLTDNNQPFSADAMRGGSNKMWKSHRKVASRVDVTKNGSD